jgi:glycosyltransferase involved in cell wall biosynthesis
MTVRQMSPGRFLREFALRDSRIRLFDAERCGLTRCLNRAIGLAQGKYLARMDADDVALPGRFQAQIDYLDANPEVLALGGQARLVSPEGWPLCQWTVPTGHEEIDAAHMTGLPGQLIHPTSMMRLDAVRSIGGLNEQWTYAQDYDLWLRLAEIGRLSNLRETVLNYRLHLSSVTFAMRRSQCESVAGIAKSARARRGIPPLSSSVDLESGEGWVGATARESRERWYRMAISGQEFSTATRIIWQLIQERPLCVSPWLGFARIAKALCRLALRGDRFKSRLRLDDCQGQGSSAVAGS